jgi:methylmalonyl-CoA mutase, N-terminal domain
LRTQQVLAYETDLTATADPLAGSYAIESMTADIRDEAGELIRRVEEMGGAVAAIEQGFQKAEIERSAYQVARQIDAGERVVVGVNKFATAADESYAPLRVDPAIERQQSERLAALRRQRDAADVRRALADIKRAAACEDNVLNPLRSALAARATVGEVCDALRDVWGVYKPADVH